MPSTLTRLLLATAAFALPLASAQAITCYIVYDRNDNAIFQDTYPPIDLSERGKTERDAMYRRGEQLVWMDAENCPQIQFITGSGGNVNLSVDEIVGGMRAAPGSTPTRAPASPSRGAAPASAPKTQTPKY